MVGPPPGALLLFRGAVPVGGTRALLPEGPSPVAEDAGGSRVGLMLGGALITWLRHLWCSMMRRDSSIERSTGGESDFHFSFQESVHTVVPSARQKPPQCWISRTVYSDWWNTMNPSPPNPPLKKIILVGTYYTVRMQTRDDMKELYC